MFPIQTPLKRAFLLMAAVVATSALQAKIKLPALFSDGMVLQKAADVPVWGWANPQEEVTVTLQGATAHTRTNADGAWRLKMDLSGMGPGPYTMQVQGDNRIEIENVVVGQVWLASGQSNMQEPLYRTEGAAEEIAAGAGNFVREFTVKRVTATSEQEDAMGQWVIAEPGRTTRFSAVAYYFAKRLNLELQQPVGIINSTWGGTPSEAWTSAQALDSDRALSEAQANRNREIETYPQRKADFDRQLIEWINQYSLTDAAFTPAEDFLAASVDTPDWTPVTFENTITGENLPERGVIWLRREVNIPKSLAGQPLSYQLQQGRGYFTIYWNGERIAGPEKWTPAELAKASGLGTLLNHRIADSLVKEGKNEIALRIYSPLETPGRIDGYNTLRGASDFSLNLNTGWKAKAEKAFAPDNAARAAAPKSFLAPEPEAYQPARLYNAMIAPLAPYRLAGVIWYQGERNADRAWQYRTAFPLVIKSWRKAWAEPNLPFYFCQLANYLAKSDTPGESDWAELREAQSHTLKLPNTGQAVLIDLGEAEDIHPRNKKDVGERLALLALANDYGHSAVIAVGPSYEAMTVAGNKVYLKFKNTGEGSELIARKLPATYPLKTANNTSKPLLTPSPGSELQGFMICGADKKWVWAQARIEGKHTVAVWSPEVQEPVAIRYAWADNPTCNLYNKAGLPAVPFRTDDFPAVTLGNRF